MVPLKLSFATATLAALLTVSGCATGPAAPAEPPSLYQRLGGRDAIAAVVDEAIGNISVDTRINHRFGNAGIAHLKSTLVDLLCARSGGPCTYGGQDMATAHEGMNIRDDEFEALIQDLGRALDKFKVPASEKAEVLALLGRMKNAIIEH